VRREALLERLVRDDARPIVSVVAPAGYGKTTLLSQWAEQNGQAFAWVSVDEADNDPKVLLAYVAAALDAVQPVGARVFDALASPVSSVPGSVVPRLGSAFASMTTPVVLVLDDVHVLRNPECRGALSVLADHVPGGSRLVLAGRDEPPLRVARLRAAGRIAEIGRGDLALSREEAALLLDAAEAAVGAADVTELHRRTEGWAAGLYLAALAVRAGGSLPGMGTSSGGSDLFVSEYIESEFLARLSREERAFLTRTAVLERMSGPLCEAVLDDPGSASALEALARSNLLLVPLDRRGQWYRYHHLFRDMLQAELERYEPSLAPALRRRAARWFLRNDLPEEALEYSIAAGDVEMAARLMERLWERLHWAGRRATLERWLRWLDDRNGVKGHPVLAVSASFLYTVTGRPAEAERWISTLDQWQRQDDWPGDPATDGYAAIIRAALCRSGVEQMRADAEEGALKFAEAGIIHPTPAFYRGLADVLSGNLEGGDVFFQDAVAWGSQTGAEEILVGALCERSLVAMARGEWAQAETLAEQARTTPHRPGAEEALMWMTQARVAMHRGDTTAVRHALADAQRQRHLLTSATPGLAVQTRIGLIRGHLALSDLPGARTLMSEVDEILHRRPGLGTLAGEARSLRVQLTQHSDSSAPGASALTAAELRLVPLLATHWSVPQIATEFSLSPNTIKSQMYSMYRKLDVSTRSQAVTRARELGLLDG